ncbi:MAG: hypothetical protein U0587_17765 [Candidatus Binatia bacterium]
MRTTHSRVLLAVLAITLAGCGDDDDDSHAAAPSSPGIFIGSMRTQSGAVALNTTVIAANGRSTVSFEERSDIVTSVATGTTEGKTLSGSLYRTGTAPENVSIDDTDTNADTLTGKVSSTQLTGTFILNRETPLDVPATLSAVAATYRFVGPDQLTWRATIAADGAITASSGNCTFTGSTSLPSNQHNTYVLELKAGTCAPFGGSVTAVAFLDAIPAGGQPASSPTLRVVYAANNAPVDLLWFRQ